MSQDVRKFWLSNARNENYNLMGQKPFLHSPTGLGFTVDLATLRLGNSQLITAESYNLGQFQADLIFFGNRPTQYQNYQTFLQFIRYTPLQLHYQTPNSNDSYFCYVRINSLGKTEISPTDGVLHVPVSMLRQTLWYSDSINTITVNNSASGGKLYPLERPYSYEPAAFTNIPVYNDSITDAPFKMELTGSITDMEYKVYDANGNQYGACKITGTYDVITIDSDELDENIYLENNGSAIANAINYQDLTVGNPSEVYVTFIKLKPGQNYIKFTPTTFSGNVTITWRNAYVSV